MAQNIGGQRDLTRSLDFSPSTPRSSKTRLDVEGEGSEREEKSQQ